MPESPIEETSKAGTYAPVDPLVSPESATVQVNVSVPVEVIET